jgi:hypothetical protein
MLSRPSQFSKIDSKTPALLLNEELVIEVMEKGHKVSAFKVVVPLKDLLTVHPLFGLMAKPGKQRFPPSGVFEHGPYVCLDLPFTLFSVTTGDCGSVLISASFAPSGKTEDVEVKSPSSPSNAQSGVSDDMERKLLPLKSVIDKCMHSLNSRCFLVAVLIQCVRVLCDRFTPDLGSVRKQAQQSVEQTKEAQRLTEKQYVIDMMAQAVPVIPVPAPPPVVLPAALQQALTKAVEVKTVVPLVPVVLEAIQQPNLRVLSQNELDKVTDVCNRMNLFVFLLTFCGVT